MDLTSYLLGKEAGGGGGTPTLQSKEVEITENGQTTVTADSGYDGLSSVAVTTNVSGGGDLSEYFGNITQSTDTYTNVPSIIIKKVPDVTVNNNVTSLYRSFRNLNIEEVGKIISTGNNVTNLQDMFAGCGELKKVDFSRFNSSNVTNMTNLFQWCTKLENVNFSEFDTTNVTITNNMFKNCYALTELNLSSFYTPNLTSTTQMFGWCEKLQKLDIRNMTFDNVTSYNDMFSDVPNNCEIIVKDDTQKTWITSKFTNLTNVKTVAEL